MTELEYRSLPPDERFLMQVAAGNYVLYPSDPLMAMLCKMKKEMEEKVEEDGKFYEKNT